MRKKIERVYKIIEQDTAIDAKDTIDILQDIELKLIGYMKYISDKQKDHYDIVYGLEKQRKEEKTKNAKA